MLRTIALACACSLAAALVPRAATAQFPTITVVGGGAHFDLDGSGIAPCGAFRLTLPFLALAGEAGIGLVRPNEKAATRTYMIPEVQIQWRMSSFLVKPYVGVGGGSFGAIAGPSPQPSDGTVSAAIGARAGIPFTNLAANAEIRGRAIGPGLARNELEFTLGASW